MKKIYIFVSALLFATTLHGQTLEECRKMAVEHYPEIRQYDLISKTEQYNVSNASRSWIPQVTLSGQATYQSATTTFPEAFTPILSASGISMTGLRNDQYKIALDISQNIWDGGQSKANKKIARAEALESKSQVDVDLYSLEAKIDELYFGILLLDEKKSQTEAMINVLQSNLDRMQAYHKNGVAMQSDIDAIEAEVLTAKQNLTQVDASIESYRRVLEIFIGRELWDKKLKRPEITEVAQQNSNRPELAMFDAQIGKIAAQKAYVNTSVTPRFSLFAQGYYGYPGMDMFQNMISSDWSFNAIVGVKMSWNISGFYTKKNNVRKLDVMEQQINVQRDIFQFNTDIQSTQETDEINRLLKALADDDRIVELRQSVRMAAESKLENGVIDATELLQKITDETTASINRSQHEIELLQTIYSLKHTLNQ